ncbi:MAG: hypothetical protein J5I90_10515 [Caldilineales bacterium]|nr:hypothetical protein [Caldilineales bacterium]
MNGWGVDLTATVASPDSATAAPPVSILLAASPERLAPLLSLFRQDARFTVAATATSAEDVRAKLTVRPDVVLAQAGAFSSFEEFAAVLGGFSGSLYALLPEETPASILQALQEMPALAEALSGEVNLPELASRIYANAHAARQMDGATERYGLLQNGPRSAMVGWRCIAVWGLQGGSGRSTLATALALEAAERRLPTLLVGLGVPDVIPLRLGFDGPEPNLNTWMATPTAEQLRACIRAYDLLDVLAGFPHQAGLDGYAAVAMNNQQGLPGLASVAARAGYAVVVLDVSAAEMAAPAISAANTLVLTALPTPDGLLAVSEATAMAGTFMSHQHSIPLEGMHLILNRGRDTLLAADEFMRSLSRMRAGTPPLAAVIPDDPRIDTARTQFRPAYNLSEPLRQASKRLGDLLFAPPPGLASQHASQTARPARVWQVGPLRIKR